MAAKEAGSADKSESGSGAEEGGKEPSSDGVLCKGCSEPTFAGAHTHGSAPIHQHKWWDPFHWFH
jgi:hypothetical protein